MFEDFQITGVEPLLEDQIHERYQFTVNVQGDEFKGMYHEGKIHWFQPQPKQHFEDVENKVHSLMTNHLK